MSKDQILEELSEELLPSKVITWEIPKFFDLPKGKDYCVLGPEFSLANATWCLQMFPNGQETENSEGEIDLLLMRLHSLNARHLVWYKLGIKTCNGGIYENFSDFRIFEGTDVVWGVSHLLELSKAFEDKKLIAENESITVFCEMQVIENGNICSKALQNSLLKMPKKPSVGQLSEDYFCTKDISWKVFDALIHLEEKGHVINSPPFYFDDAKWCLQMYLLKTDENGTFGLKLVRLFCDSLMQTVYYTLGLKNRFGKVYDTYKNQYKFGKKITKCWDLNLLRQSQSQKYSVIALNGCVTVYCRLHSMVDYGKVLPQNEESVEVVLPKFYVKGTSEQELCHQSTVSGVEDLTWKIANFSELPEKEDYYLDSSEFYFGNAKWCLRMYPNGKIGNSQGWVQLFLIRLKSCVPTHLINYTLGLMNRQNKKHESLPHVTTFQDSSQAAGVLDIMKRSEFTKDNKKFNGNDVLSLFCQVLMVTEKAECKEFNAPFTSYGLKSGKKSKKSQLSCPSTVILNQAVVTWGIPNFFSLPTKENDFIDSEEFSFANASWCLRIYPDGQKGNNNNCMHLMLVRLHSSKSQHYIHFRLGLKLKHDQELGGLTHAAMISTNAVETGVVNLLNRSAIKSSKRFKLNGIFTVFCHIVMVNGETSISLTQRDKTKSSPEIPVVKIPKPSSNDFSSLLFSPVKEFLWKLPSFFLHPEEENCWMDSSVFFFMLELWCLRIHIPSKINSNQRISIYLIRISDCYFTCSLSYELSILKKSQEWRPFKKCCSNDVFKNCCTLIGTSPVYIASDGFMTINLKLLGKERTVTVSSCESSKCLSNYHTRVVHLRYGVMCEQTFLAATQVTWNVPNFFQIKVTTADFCINSHTFQLANDSWLLKLYPFGLETDSNISIVFERLTLSSLKPRVICKIDIKNSLYTIISNKFDSTFDDKFMSSYLMHFPRAKIINKLKKGASKGSFIIFCQMYVIEEFKDANSEVLFPENSSQSFTSSNDDTMIDLKMDKNNISSGEELNDNIQKSEPKCEVNNLLDEKDAKEKVCDLQEVKHQAEKRRDEMNLDSYENDDIVLKYELFNKEPVLVATEIIWKIPYFLKLKRGTVYCSPHFIVANNSWCLQFSSSKKKINLTLIRLSSHSANTYHITCNFRFKSSLGKIIHHQKEYIFWDKTLRSDPVNIKRKCFQNEAEYYLMVFCQMHVGEETSKIVKYLQRHYLKPTVDFCLNDGSLFTCQKLYDLIVLDSAVIVWKVPNFFQSEMNRKIDINSPQFSLANDLWFLQLYTIESDKGSESLGFFLVKQSSTSYVRHRVLCNFVLKSSCKTIASCDSDSIFDYKCSKSTPALLKKREIKAEDVSEVILTVFCNLHILRENEKASSEVPLPAKFSVPMSNVNTVNELKMDISNISPLRETNDSFQEVSLKESENSAVSERLNETFEELDFTHLKKKKKINYNTFPVLIPVKPETGEIEIGENCVKNNGNNFKLDESCSTSHFEELKSDSLL